MSYKKGKVYITKKVVRKDGILTTVRVKVGDDPKHKKIQKLRILIKKYNSTIKMLNKDIAEQGDKGLAALGVKMIAYLGLRVGNEKSASGYVSLKTKKQTFTYGLTTLTKDHVKLNNGIMTLEFVGKKGVNQNITITNKDLVKEIMWAMSKSKGDKVLGIGYKEINNYIRKNIGKEFSPKDFRGLRANLEAIKKIAEVSKREAPKTKTEANAELNEIATHVSNVLGNTMGVAKRSYIDSDILMQHLHSRYNPKKKRRKKRK